MGTWSENSAFCFSECLTTAILLKALKCVILRSEKTYKSVLKLSLVFWADIYFFEVAVLFSSKSREVLITLGKKGSSLSFSIEFSATYLLASEETISYWKLILFELKYSNNTSYYSQGKSRKIRSPLSSSSLPATT